MHPGESIGLLRVSWWLTDGELAVGCALGAPVRAVNDWPALGTHGDPLQRAPARGIGGNPPGSVVRLPLHTFGPNC